MRRCRRCRHRRCRRRRCRFWACRFSAYPCPFAMQIASEMSRQVQQAELRRQQAEQRRQQRRRRGLQFDREQRDRQRERHVPAAPAAADPEAAAGAEAAAEGAAAVGVARQAGGASGAAAAEPAGPSGGGEGGEGGGAAAGPAAAGAARAAGRESAAAGGDRWVDVRGWTPHPIPNPPGTHVAVEPWSGPAARAAPAGVPLDLRTPVHPPVCPPLSSPVCRLTTLSRWEDLFNSGSSEEEGDDADTTAAGGAGRLRGAASVCAARVCPRAAPCSPSACLPFRRDCSLRGGSGSQRRRRSVRRRARGGGGGRRRVPGGRRRRPRGSHHRRRPGGGGRQARGRPGAPAQLVERFRGRAPHAAGVSLSRFLLLHVVRLRASAALGQPGVRALPSSPRLPDRTLLLLLPIPAALHWPVQPSDRHQRGGWGLGRFLENPDSRLPAHLAAPLRRTVCRTPHVAARRSFLGVCGSLISQARCGLVGTAVSRTLGRSMPVRPPCAAHPRSKLVCPPACRRASWGRMARWWRPAAMTAACSSSQQPPGSACGERAGCRG